MDPHDATLEEPYDPTNEDLHLNFQDVPLPDMTPQEEDGSRYLYDTETDLWYDSVTKEFSHYDQEQQLYFTVLVDDDDEENNDSSGATKTPAEVRLVVVNSPLLTPDHILVVVEEGLTVGRDRSWDRRLRLPELPVSKFHCQIFYNDDVDDEDHRGFYLTDLGSRNGTFVNHIRLSEPKTSSVPIRLNDLDIITIGSTTFQVHHHRKGWQCDRCRTREDNVIDISQRNGKRIKAATAAEAATSAMGEPKSFSLLDLRSREQKERDWVEELRRRKRSLAPKKGSTTTEPIDAAERRRRLFATVPSYLRPVPVPPAPPPTEQQQRPEHLTERAAIDTPVQGIGKAMLRKMGWKEGQSLGPTGADGIVVPINPKTQKHRAGLGKQSISSPSPRRSITQITQERYSALP